MSGISTHVLDTSLGVPAGGIQVTLEREAPEDYAVPWVHCATGTTDADGRCRPLLAEEKVKAGTYRLHFATGAYFRALEQPEFYPEVVIAFAVAADAASCHVPLLLSPFGYTTYRGS